MQTFTLVFIFTRKLWIVIYFIKYLEHCLAFAFRWELLSSLFPFLFLNPLPWGAAEEQRDVQGCIFWKQVTFWACRHVDGIDTPRRTWPSGLSSTAMLVRKHKRLPWREGGPSREPTPSEACPTTRAPAAPCAGTVFPAEARLDREGPFLRALCSALTPLISWLASLRLLGEGEGLFHTEVGMKPKWHPCFVCLFFSKRYCKGLTINRRWE